MRVAVKCEGPRVFLRHQPKRVRQSLRAEVIDVTESYQMCSTLLAWFGLNTIFWCNFIYNAQTLIAGILAVLGGAATLAAAGVQIRENRRAERRAVIASSAGILGLVRFVIAQVSGVHRAVKAQPPERWRFFEHEFHEGAFKRAVEDIHRIRPSDLKIPAMAVPILEIQHSLHVCSELVGEASYLVRTRELNREMPDTLSAQGETRLFNFKQKLLAAAERLEASVRD